MQRLLIIPLLIILVSACSNTNWRTASRESAGIAVNPTIHKEAIIEFYAADAFSWRGWFAVHTWIAIKEKEATLFTVFEVVGWRVENGYPALRQYTTKTPDRFWYGAKPEKFHTVVGEKAEQLIPEIKRAVERYPWANEYTLFPGPNSNTFPTWIGLQVPQLELQMPLRAIGSGYAE